MSTTSTNSVAKESGTTLSQLRVQTYNQRMKSDHKDAAKQSRKFKTSIFNQETRNFMQHLASIVVARAIVLGPVERMRIVQQVSPQAVFINVSDRPKGTFDLISKISMNQGMFAFWRGGNSLIYKLTLQHSFRFFVYDAAINQLSKNREKKLDSKTLIGLSSVISALCTTTVTYPFDMAQGKMAADMSQKPSLFHTKKVTKNSSKVPSMQSAQDEKVYLTVRDCFAKTRASKSGNKGSLFAGYRLALAAQVPYTVLLFSSFEGFNFALEQLSNADETFHKYDEYTFAYKFLQRFGASTLSIVLAQSVSYPLDTLKRRLQVNATKGYTRINFKNEMELAKHIWTKEGPKSFYKGFHLALLRNIPLAFIQFTCFQNLKGISGTRTEVFR